MIVNETPITRASLPEDLAPLNRGANGRPSGTTPLVTISRNGMLLNRPARDLLGNPFRAQILFGQKSRMVALRATTDPSGYRCTTQGRAGTVRIGYQRLLERFGMPPHPEYQPLRFPAQLIDGALLIGPLPEAES